ncbi:MAG: glycosyltransferase family 2 protein [Bacteroidota bacterium]
MTIGLISVIIPVFNAESSIKETLESVLKQSYLDWEIIIVDDCSTDNSMDVIRSAIKSMEKQTSIISLTENNGVANARNVGLDNVNGEFVAFLDSDDIWSTEKLEKQLRFMQNLRCDISYTAYKKIDENGVVKSMISVAEKVSYNDLLHENVIPFSSSMLRRSKLLNHRFLKVGHEDFVFWLAALKHISMAYGLNEPLMYYRISANSISSDKFKAAKFTWNIYRKIEGFTVFKSAYYFVCYSFSGLRKYLK